jgi:hypothetical protein
MWVAPVCIDMYEPDTVSQSAYSAHSNHEQRTLGGLVAYLLTVPALVAVMAAPALAVGAMLGVAGLTLGPRVVRRLRRLVENSHPSQSATAGRPA